MNYLDMLILCFVTSQVFIILHVVEHFWRLSRKQRQLDATNQRMAREMAYLVKRMEVQESVSMHEIAALHEMMYHDFVRKPTRRCPTPDDFFPIYIGQVRGEG